WSPDSRFLAFVEAADNQFQQVKILEISSGQITAVTSDRVDSYNPSWSPDGKWLYFLSDRYFRSVVRSPWGPRQPEPYFDRSTKIYALGLSGKDVFPWTPQNELLTEKKASKGEVKSSSSSPAKKSSQKSKEAPPKVRVEINFQGLQDRVFEVPLPPGVYSNLGVGQKELFFIDRESRATGKPKLKAVTVTNRRPKPVTLVENVRRYELSASGKKIMVQKGSEFYVIEAKPRKPASLAESKVDLSKWQFSIDPRSEWRQMFVDAWRMERDYFYDRNLHGVDYEGLLQRHLPYLERVSDRQELNDLIAHLVGELSALHIFVRGGDIRRPPDNILPGSLGAKLVKDKKAGGWRIAHIYRTDPDYPEKFSPLARPGLKIKEGDVIVAINGRSTLEVKHPSLLLRNTTGTQVLLELKGSDGQLYKEIVYPITLSAEYDLRYSEWEYTRRLQVEKQTAGKVGYVHLRAMGGNNYTEWVKNFYPVYNRQGLIIDVRHNRGGNIDSWILEKLLRKAWFYWQDRVGNPTWNMQYAFRGHMVVLCNEYTASDGEAFTEGFRRLGLGKVIGTRTWGGEIWLSSSNVLVDWGIATAAESGVYGPEREWLIEGHGVEPDIVVDNLPYETFQGRDAQLERAIAFLEELIKKDPVEIPPHPPYPVKK
ncbi:MAG TPA: protease, partial [Desulfobacteraceae bacterium]|nr:protease [Desulfobacteraceae bacterium]